MLRMPRSTPRRKRSEGSGRGSICGASGEGRRRYPEGGGRNASDAPRRAIRCSESASLGRASHDRLSRRSHGQAIAPLFDAIRGLDGVSNAVAPVKGDIVALIADESGDPSGAYQSPDGSPTIPTCRFDGNAPESARSRLFGGDRAFGRNAIPSISTPDIPTKEWVRPCGWIPNVFLLSAFGQRKGSAYGARRVQPKAKRSWRFCPDRSAQ